MQVTPSIFKAYDIRGTYPDQIDAALAHVLTAERGLPPTLNLSLDVDNVFDKVHYTSSYSRLWVTPGTARTVTVGLQAKF